MKFAPEYRVHQHTRTLKVPTEDNAPSRTVTRTYGEHVMSYRLFCTLNYKDIVRLLKGGA